MNYLTDNHRSSDQRISCVETNRCRSSTFLVKKKLTAAWPYNTAAWSHLRRVKLDEQSDSEPSRDAGLLTLANTVDHVVPINAVGEPFSATRSALHRCLQRHGISRLLDIESDKPKRQRFKRYPIGFFHIDIAEVQTAEGKLYLFVGIDCTSKFAVTQLVEKADRRRTWEFLEYLLKAVPYRIHTILTDNPILSKVEGAFSSPSNLATATPPGRARCAST